MNLLYKKRRTLGAFLFNGTDDDGQTQQRKAINALAEGRSVTWFVEQGRGSVPPAKRVALQRAITHCGDKGSAFAIASVRGFAKSRVSGLAILEEISERGVHCEVADDPLVSKSNIAVLAAQADLHREQLLFRQNAAYKRIKKKLAAGEKHITQSGKEITKLGAQDTKAFSALGNNAKTTAADNFALTKWKHIKPLLDRGMNQSEIARQLNIQGVEFRGGKSWAQPSIFRILQRIKSLGES